MLASYLQQFKIIVNECVSMNAIVLSYLSVYNSSRFSNHKTFKSQYIKNSKGKIDIGTTLKEVK